MKKKGKYFYTTSNFLTCVFSSIMVANDTAQSWTSAYYSLTKVTNEKKKNIQARIFPGFFL